MSELKTFKRGDYLFKENDPSDCMFIIKQGRVEISRNKGESQVVLAEKKSGEMLGEMAFFDGRPRSANAKALMETQVIALPFKSLHAQYDSFPEWLKITVRTVTTQLRQANTKIKNLEQTFEGDEVVFTPHMIVKLLGILGLMSLRYGEPVPDGKGRILSESHLLRHTIQVFSAPKNKMEKLLKALSVLGQIHREDLGEGRFRLHLKDPELMSRVVDFYSEYLFKEESKRTEILAKEIWPLQVLTFYSQDLPADAKGYVTVNLTEAQKLSMQDLNQAITMDQFFSLSEKKVIEPLRQDETSVTVRFHKKQIRDLFEYWQLIHFLLNYKES